MEATWVNERINRLNKIPSFFKDQEVDYKMEVALELNLKDFRAKLVEIGLSRDPFNNSLFYPYLRITMPSKLIQPVPIQSGTLS